MKSLVHYVHILAIVAVLTSSARSEETIDTALEKGPFKTLTAALKSAGVTHELSELRELTLFAPTDEAFAKLPKGTVETLLKPENREQLKSILRYHVTGSVIPPPTFRSEGEYWQARDGKSYVDFGNLQGGRLLFSTKDAAAFVNGVSVRLPELKWIPNGFIYPIDSVLMPPASDTDGAIAADNIVEVADKAGTFRTLLAAAKAAGLAHSLQEDGPFTVFAPTDDAFAKLPSDSLKDLLKPENKDRLTTILKYHVISGKVAAKDAVLVESAETLSGDSVSISIRDGRLAVNNAYVIVNDVEASNGIIHVIDSVLMPEPQNIVETAESAGTFKTLLAAAKAAGLLDTLALKGPYTVFAPTDEAFGKLPDGTLESLLKPENRERLTAILTYHVVPRKMTKADAIIFADSGLFERPDPFADSQISKRPDERGLSTINGQKLEITSVSSSNPKRFPWKLLVNDATIVKADLAASNGVIHAIDSVLMPPADETKQHKKTAHTVSSAKVGGSSATSHSDIVAAAAAAGNFKTLIAAIKAAGLAETLKGDGPFTVLAPSDEAFAKLPKGTIETLLKPENKEQLVAILKYHVIQGRRTAGELPHWGGARSLQGTVIRIRSNAPLTFNNSKVVKPDINCSNGVIHVVDTVLMPDDAPEGPFDQDSEFRLLQRLDPALTSHLKSVRGGNETSVVFSNLSSKPIQVYWIAFDGQRKKWREPIDPGSLDICDVSFDKHVWLLTDEHDNALGLYILDKQNGVVIHK